MMDHMKMQTAYQTTRTFHSNHPRRRKNRLLSLVKLAALVLFMVAAMAGIHARLSSFYGVHVSGWHQVTVTQGQTVYGFASASNAGYLPTVEQAIDSRNHLVDGQIYAGMTLYVPDKQGVK